MHRLLGLRSETLNIYRLLLQDNHLTDDALVRETGLTPADVVQARAELLEAGLVRMSLDDSDRMVLVNPELVLDRHLRQREAELARQQEEISRSRSAVQALVGEYLDATSQPQRVGEAVELVGLDEIRSVMENQSATVKREVLALHPKSEYSHEELDAAEEMDLLALGRGVTMRSVYPAASRSSARTVRYHQAVTRRGAEIRYADKVPTRMLVFDRTTGIIPLHAADNGRAAVLLQGEAVTSMLVLIFELAWSNAAPLTQVDEAPVLSAGANPSDVDRILLQLMSMGVKDEAAARHLGVSVRTVRRQIAELMSRLEASSRFEAGVRAAIRGWVEPPSWS